jgi:hypothetical protein
MPKNVDTTAKTATIPPDLGGLSDKKFAKEREIEKLNAKVKDLEKEKAEIEQFLLAAMQDAGTDICRGKLSTTSISEILRPKIDDFDTFSQFCLRKKALHLFERRIASTAYKEMKDLLGGKPIPGLSEYIQVRLNTRKA